MTRIPETFLFFGMDITEFYFFFRPSWSSYLRRQFILMHAEKNEVSIFLGEGDTVAKVARTSYFFF